MKNRKKDFLILSFLFCSSYFAYAQPGGGGGGPGDGQPVPLSGIEYLICFGALLGVQKIVSSLKKGSRAK